MHRYQLPIRIATTAFFKRLISPQSAFAFHSSAFFNMPPKKVITNGKRKASPDTTTTDRSPKKAKTNGSTDRLRQPHPNAQETEDNGIVLREFYPHEMSNARALAYNNDELPRPIELLNSALSETQAQRAKVKVKDAVVHWYKCDLRTKDNHALHLASEKAQSKGVPLICMYIVSPQDFEAHLTAPVRVDFILRTLEVLKDDLGKLNIPLYVETVEKRKKIPGRVLELLEEWGASHLYTNVEYEVDELRREASLVRTTLERGIAMDVLADTCVVSPGELQSGSGKQYAVYSPWYRSWVTHVHSKPDLLDKFEAPSENPSDSRQKYASIFECEIPAAPSNKTLSPEEKKRFRSMWPAGEDEAYERLKKFAKERIGGYKDNRNFPGELGTSSLSPHFACGSLSSRTAIHHARDTNSTKKLDGGSEGIKTWIGEVAWRDFYKHVLAHWPYVW
jgi:deoxyribodipyrimidine photo-lyase